MKQYEKNRSNQLIIIVKLYLDQTFISSKMKDSKYEEN